MTEGGGEGERERERQRERVIEVRFKKSGLIEFINDRNNQREKEISPWD
jgi:hypothetical protein